ncbi:MAG: hypothetical protein ACK4V6_15170, partial [Microthrixaceae bacterium]
MQNCPRCQMLMDDHETLCSTCAAEQPSSFAASTVPIGSAGSATGPGAVGAPPVAVLDRPVAVPMPATVQYRQSGRARSGGPVAAVVVLLLGAVGVLVFMGARGDGPLARTVVEVGLVAPPAVSIPTTWGTYDSTAGGFSVELPANAVAVDEPIDAADPAAGSAVGYEVPLGVGGEAAVVAMSGPALQSTLDAVDDAGFVDLVRFFIADSPDGEATVTRDVPTGNGRAVDVVQIDEDA